MLGRLFGAAPFLCREQLSGERLEVRLRPRAIVRDDLGSRDRSQLQRLLEAQALRPAREEAGREKVAGAVVDDLVDRGRRNIHALTAGRKRPFSLRVTTRVSTLSLNAATAVSTCATPAIAWISSSLAKRCRSGPGRSAR